MISLIFPVFNEQANLKELYARVSDIASSMSAEEFEFIFVDDGSTDGTREILLELNRHDRRVKVIRLTSNWGSHAAIAAGLNHCKGDCAVILAADLQDPPEVIPRLLDAWGGAAKVVWGVRAKREGEKRSTRFFSRLYYFLMNALTVVRMPPLGADLFLADRAVIDAFRHVSSKHASVFMTIVWLGFPQSSISYVKRSRLSGKSKWTVAKKIKLALDSLLAFSDVPIRYMSVLGFFVAFLGLLYAGHTFWRYLGGTPAGGWPSVMIAVLVIGGVQMMMLGVLGEYLWRTFDQSLQRPRYVIESITDRDRNEESILKDAPHERVDA
jgi:dolichol-phosphate mannosyltransferase